MTLHELKTFFNDTFNREATTIYYSHDFETYHIKPNNGYSKEEKSTHIEHGVYLLVCENIENTLNFWSLNEPGITFVQFDDINIEKEEEEDEEEDSWMNGPLEIFSQHKNNGLELYTGYNLFYWGHLPADMLHRRTEILQAITTQAIYHLQNINNTP